MNKDGKQNIVKEVEFSVDDLVNGAVDIPYVDGNFLDYSTLTEDTVVGWIKAVLSDAGVAAFEDRVAQLNAPAITGYIGLPWVS